MACLEVVQSWGVASARHTSACVVHQGDVSTEFCFDVPMGPSVVRWNVSTNQRLLFFQAHSDAVACMRMSHDHRFLATTGFSGEVKLWSSSEWTCLDSKNAPMKSQCHLAWSHDSKHFLVVGNGYESSIVMYALEDVETSPKLSQRWQAKAGCLATEVKGQSAGFIGQSSASKGQASATPSLGSTASEVGVAISPQVSSGAKSYVYPDAFYMAEINPSGTVFAVEEQSKGSSLVELYSPEGGRVKWAELVIGGKQEKLGTLMISMYHHSGCYAVAVQGGHVIIVGAESLDIMNIIKTGYTSRTCVWDGDLLVLPSDSGKLIWWSLSGEKMAEFSVGSGDYIVRADWSVSGAALWLCGFSTLRYVKVERRNDDIIGVNSDYVIRSHDITCCGVGFSPSGRSLGSGDLAGNVWETVKKDYQPKLSTSVGMSVRCLVWACEGVMLVGALDGGIYRWGVGGASPPSPPSLLTQLEGSVIHMRFDHTHKRLAVGTSKGLLLVYDIERGVADLNLVTVVTAHPPEKGESQDMRFGQLGKQAEIWSLCWNPDDTMIATCSEDQTTRIWDTQNWQRLKVLVGHTLAVTSVDWKLIGQTSILATCSDDRTVRLCDGVSFQLLKVLDTKDVFGWHTLTYLAFSQSEDSPQLLCTTQNGHVVLWNVLEGQRLYTGKIHCGSIEGLAWNPASVEWNGNCIATVGADCVVNMFKFSLL